MTFSPTPEQQTAIDLARTGDSLKMQALAGTGKTATLAAIAADRPDTTMTYVAFNRSIVDDAAGRFPGNVRCATSHALAMRAVGQLYRHRLGARRQPSWTTASMLGVDDIVVSINGTSKRLSAGFLAGLVTKALNNFSHSADPEPSDRHVPLIPGIDIPGETDNARRVRTHVAQYLPAAWRDICSTTGSLPFSHDCYLRIWEQSGPKIPTDVILLDEAQDVNPALWSIVRQQAGHAQIILVGDAQQQIYSWRGASNAMKQAATSHECWLTGSFRFGQPIAEVANVALAMLAAGVDVVGNPNRISTVMRLPKPVCSLYRTNGGALRAMIDAMADGRKVAYVGDTKGLVSFFTAAQKLQEGRRVEHFDLAMFDSWGEVQAYVDTDPNGEDLKLLVDLVTKFGARKLADVLSQAGDESRAEAIFSTAHKSKGREWSTVKLGSDFPVQPADDEAWRLLYVAATRAIDALDISLVPALRDLVQTDKDPL